jgi:hypothetical protein
MNETIAADTNWPLDGAAFSTIGNSLGASKNANLWHDQTQANTQTANSKQYPLTINTPVTPDQ